MGLFATDYVALCGFLCGFLETNSPAKTKAKQKENPVTLTLQGFSCGAPWGIRTHDLLIRSQTLYPAELRAHAA